MTWLLIIVLITGESGPIEMSEAECRAIEREFRVAQAMRLPVLVDRADGSSETVTAMQCIAQDTALKGAGS